VVLDSLVYSDCLCGDDLYDASGRRHFRINNTKLFAKKKYHSNKFAVFCNQMKSQIRKNYGDPKEDFRLFWRNVSSALTAMTL
jgi:transposase